MTFFWTSLKATWESLHVPRVALCIVQAAPVLNYGIIMHPSRTLMNGHPRCRPRWQQAKNYTDNYAEAGLLSDINTGFGRNQKADVLQVGLHKDIEMRLASGKNRVSGQRNNMKCDDLVQEAADALDPEGEAAVLDEGKILARTKNLSVHLVYNTLWIGRYMDKTSRMLSHCAQRWVSEVCVRAQCRLCGCNGQAAGVRAGATAAADGAPAPDHGPAHGGARRRHRGGDA